MKLAIAALLFTAGASAAPSSKESSYSRWMAESFFSKGVPPRYKYDQSTLYTGLEKIIAHTKEDKFKEYFRSQVDAIVMENGTMIDYDYSHHSLDNYRFGNNLLWWYTETGEKKYKKAADDIKEMLNAHPRTPTGGFWHRDPTYPNQMWLDGIYMADSFYAKYVSMFQPNNQTAWDDIELQYDKIEEVCRTKNNLLVHGFDESKTAVWADPETGAAPLIWARAVGWYFMSLLEAIDLFPKSHPGRAKLINYFVALAEGVKDSQDESGGWWNIMDEQYKNVEGNYIESSASAMFTFGWLKGINDGLLEKSEYKDVATKAYKSLVDDFITHNKNGTLNWEGTVTVGSLGSNATFEYYASIGLKENDYRGAGSFIAAAVEFEKGKF